MSQINQFDQACNAWIFAALQLLQRSQSQPFYEDFDLTFEVEGRYSTHPGTPKLDVARLIMNNNNALFGLPEYETLVDIIIQTSALSSALCPTKEGQPPNNRDSQRAIIGGYFSTFLTEYIKTKQDLTFSSSLYEHIYQKLEQYIYGTEPITIMDYIHIRNLRTEIDNVAIGKEVFLRQATYEEKKTAFITPRQGLGLPIIPETILEIHHRIAATAHLPVAEQEKTYETAKAVVFALRLIKPDFVEEGMHYDGISDQPFRPARGMGSSIFRNPFSSHHPYIFTPDDVDAITKLWPKAKKAYNKPELLVARTRFEGSYLRTTLEDMLIDYWIGLEALFLPQDYTREMAEAVALAVSNYLGRTGGNRNSIYEEVINSHKLRGKVVHGKQKQGDAEKLREMTAKTGELLRRSLRQRIEE